MKKVDRKPRRVHVHYTDGRVDYVPNIEALDLVEKGKAIFISNTLYRAAKAGMDIKHLKDKSDKFLKPKIKSKSTPKAPKSTAYSN